MLVGDRQQFGGSFPGLFAAAAAKIDAELLRTRIHASLQRAHNGSGDSRRVPVHAHDAAERLKPERIAKPREKFADAVVSDNVFGDGRPELFHPLGEPGRHAPAVQRQISESRASHFLFRS